jgi:hypothetical protein
VNPDSPRKRTIGLAPRWTRTRAAWTSTSRPPGAPYPALRSRALELQLEQTVPVAGIDDLIAMKRAGGRPIDRSDILALTDPGRGSIEER